MRREIVQLLRFTACLLALWGHASAIALNAAFIVACVEPSGGTHLEFKHDPARPIGEVAPPADTHAPGDEPAFSHARCLHEHQDAHKNRRDVPTGEDLKWLALDPAPCLLTLAPRAPRGAEHAAGALAARADTLRPTLRI